MKPMMGESVFTEPNKKYLQEKFIDIEDENQLVPLFLANDCWGKDVTSENNPGLQYGNLNVGWPQSVYRLLGHVTSKTKDAIKASMKAHLMTLLNKPYPKRYCFALPLDFMLFSQRSSFLIPNNSLTIPNTINSGTNAPRSPIVITGGGTPTCVSSLGFLAEFTEMYTYTLPMTGNYDAADMVNHLGLGHIAPRLLIVVKAKYIPYIRARMYLQLPLELPVDGMKILRTQANSISTNAIATSYENGLGAMKAEGVEEVFTTLDDIRNYLYRSTGLLSTEDYMKNVLQYADL